MIYDLLGIITFIAILAALAFGVWVTRP